MPNCAVRFMDNNYAIPDTARITYSSQLTNFPASNASNARRSRLWIPGGNFTITEENNLLYINDGSDKTVTLTVGNYTYATLAAHIQTRLNVSSTNWTCAYSTTTRRFTINRTSGAATLRTSVTMDAVWESIGFATGADDPSGPFVSDVGVNHTDEWYKCDFVQALNIMAFMACWSIDRASPFDGAADVRIQMNNIDQWDNPPVDVDLTAFDRGIYQFFEEVDTIYRYCRFWFSNPGNSCGPEGFYFGNIYMGGYRTVTVSNVAPGINKKLVDQSKIEKSVVGSDYARKLPKYREFSSMDMQLLDAAERRALEQMISKLGNTENFYFCLDPLSEVTADLDEATFYAKFDREPTLDHIIRDRYTLKFDLREVV